MRSNAPLVTPPSGSNAPLFASQTQIEQSSCPLARRAPSVENDTFEGKAGLLIRKHDHYTPARKMRRDVRALTATNPLS